MSLSVSECLDKFQEARSRVKFLNETLEEKAFLIEKKKDYVGRLVKARWVLSEVAKITQERFKNQIEKLVTMAIRGVFKDRSYKFVLRFERKRNKLECVPIVEEKLLDGRWVEYFPKEEDVGVGMIDIMGFAFKIVLRSLEKPKSRNVMLLDEPMKNMGSLISLGGQVLRKISHKLGLKLIINTHETELIEIADNSILLEHNGEFSEVKSNV